MVPHFPSAPKTDLAYVARYDGTGTTILFGENMDATYWAYYSNTQPASFVPYEAGSDYSSSNYAGYEDAAGLTWWDLPNSTGYVAPGTPTVGLNQGLLGLKPGIRRCLAPWRRTAEATLPALKSPRRRIQHHLLRRPHDVHEPRCSVPGLCRADDPARGVCQAVGHCRGQPRLESDPTIAAVADGPDLRHRTAPVKQRARGSQGSSPADAGLFLSQPALRLKEPRQDRPALGHHHARDGLHAVVEPRIGKQLIERVDGTRLGIDRSIDQRGNPSLQDRAGAIGQGSGVAYSVQPSNRQLPSASAACVMAIILA